MAAEYEFNIADMFGGERIGEILRLTNNKKRFGIGIGFRVDLSVKRPGSWLDLDFRNFRVYDSNTSDNSSNDLYSLSILESVGNSRTWAQETDTRGRI